MKLISGAQSVSCAFVALCGVYVIGLFHIAAAQTTQANATTNHLKVPFSPCSPPLFLLVFSLVVSPLSLIAFD